MLPKASGANNEIRSKIPTHYFIFIYICMYIHTYIFICIYCHSQYLNWEQKYIFFKKALSLPSGNLQYSGVNV